MIKRAAAALSPFLVLCLFVFGMRFVLAGASALLHASILIFICSIALLLSGVWLARSFLDRQTKILQVAGIIVVYVGWLWQRFAYLRFVPERFLQYGYFLTGPGKSARFFVLELPFEIITALLAIGLMVACVTAWRAGARWSLISLVMWWLVAFVIFALPSLNLYLQGDAAIYI